MRLQKTIYRITFFVLILFIAGCRKDVNTSACPINFETDSSANEVLEQKWKLVGFQSNGSSEIDYPPCIGYQNAAALGNNFEITISFADTIHNLDTTYHTYPYLFAGKAPVNGFSGTYETDGFGNLWTDDLITTEKAGPKELMDYESMYYGAISNAMKYTISFNVLKIYFSLDEYMILVPSE